MGSVRYSRRFSTRVALVAAVGFPLLGAGMAHGALLDGVSATAGAAYSLRKVSDGYSGSSITVRRDSDQATADIGFTAGGGLDTAALLTFVGGGNGYVTTWYDQSANAVNVTQATASRQPQIVAAGAVVTSANGAPAIRFTGSNTTTTATGNTALAATTIPDLYPDNVGGTVIGSASFSVEPGSTQIVQRFFTLHSANSSRLTVGGDDGVVAAGYNNNGSFLDTNSTYDPVLGQTFVFSLVADASGVGTTDTLRLYADGASVLNLTGRDLRTDENALGIGALQADGTRAMSGTISEMLFFPSVLSTTDRQFIESSQSIAYVPEPGTVGMLALGGLMLFRRRGDRHGV